MAREEVLALARQYLRKVKKSGPSNVLAICPFHRKEGGQEEQHGSFALNIDNGLWYCHSCHGRGNFRTFLREMGLSYGAMDLQYKYLLEELDHARPPRPDPLNPVEAATEPLDESFLGLFDEPPEDFLAEGFSPETLRQHDVGFDKTHQRITFPLRDWRGRLVGISGRSVTPGQRRYKIYDWEYTDWGLPPRTLERRALLWNIHNVYRLLGFEVPPAERRVVVVEGFKACLRLLDAGAKNTVALLGSEMTDEQLWLLERLGYDVWLMLDNNRAGQHGTERVGRRLMRSLTVRKIEYPTEQPSDLTPEQVRRALDNPPYFDLWYLRQHLPSCAP